MKYLIRLDDAYPTMDINKWNFIESVLDKYYIKPIVAVIPNNEDEQMNISKHDNDFWDKVKKWENKGWAIALHGYNHVYTTKEGGLVPKNKKSEFVGLPIEKQIEKIRAGINIFRTNNINPKIWVAPSHTFDINTLKALKQESDIDIISDGIAFNTYYDLCFKWIPQQISSFYKMPFGLWTICLHPNTMTKKQLQNFAIKIKLFKNNIISCNKIVYSNKNKTFLDKIFNYLYWKIKKIKKKFIF